MATLTGTSGNDTITGYYNQSDSISGGAGNDVLGYPYYTNYGDNDTLDGGEGNDTLSGSLYGNSSLLGGTGNDQLYGYLGYDSLNGGTGDDTLYGGAGNDTLQGGAGADELYGGNGDDVFIVDAYDTLVFEDVNQGIDTVQSSIDWSLADNFENLVLTGSTAVYGLGNELSNSITGNAADNYLTGNEGDDTLIGGLGADVLIGGAGNDLYIVDNAADTTLENEDDGIDLVQSSVSWTLDINIENLTLTGTETISGTGNELANIITGTNAANNLFGREGNDMLFGMDGNDALSGDSGDDNLDGGIANDTLDGGEGNDILYGRAGNDSLNGGAGADTLYGGAGDDVYIYDGTADSIIELANEGNDTVIVTATTALSLSFANVEKVIVNGSAAISITGDGLANNITGNTGANSLAGGAGNDTLYGLDGNDTLDGGTGSDKLYGGIGDDTYIVDVSTDVIVELVNAGSDLVRSSASYTLSGYIENLILTGTLAINGSGNGENNQITGNSATNNLIGNAGNDTLDGAAGHDVLNGGVGLDRLIGGAGNDVMTGGTNSDTFVFTAGFGKDTISDFNAGSGPNHDVLEISKAIFADWNALLSNTSQAGADLVIRASANDIITLKNVTLASFTSDDVVFVS